MSQNWGLYHIYISHLLAWCSLYWRLPVVDLMQERWIMIRTNVFFIEFFAFSICKLLMWQLNVQHLNLDRDMPIWIPLLTVQHSQTSLSLYPLDIRMLILSDFIISAKPLSMALADILQRLNWNRGNWLSKLFGVLCNLDLDLVFFGSRIEMWHRLRPRCFSPLFCVLVFQK